MMNPDKEEKTVKPLVMGMLGVSDHYNLRVSVPVAGIDEVRMKAVASRDITRAGEAASRWGLEKAYGSYDELLADDEIEAVYIPLPNHLHGEWIRKCADAGKHVLCEKPLELNHDRAAEAVAYAESKGILLMEAFMYRFHPQWIRAKELLQIGEIGTPRSIHTIFTFDLNDPTNIRNIREFGGGAILDIGCYAVSSARFLFDREPVRVVSMMDRHPDFETDVLVSGMLDFGDARSVFTVSTNTAPQQKVRVYGSGGSLTVDVPFNAYPDVPLKVTVETGVGTRDIMCGPADQYAEMFTAFAGAIRAGGPVPTPPSDALANMKVLDALFRSAETGGWVEVQAG
jgi:predicted dehydrogenase